MGFAPFSADGPLAVIIFDLDRSRSSEDLTTVSPDRAGMTLEQGMRIQPNAVAVDEPGDRTFVLRTDHRTKVENARRVDPLHRCKRCNGSLELIEIGELLCAGMDQYRHSMPERDVGKVRLRLFKKAAARKRQGPDVGIAKRIMEHGRASA